MAIESHVQVQAGREAVATEGGLPRDAYALLAQANLLRMRGRWAEAIEQCMKALTLSPDNASAQSLLGDIYENQGLLDDAIQWYRMALDVHPDSPADKMKLARVVESKSRTLPPAPSRALPPVDSDSTSGEWPQAARQPHEKSETLLRRTAYGAGGLTLLVIVFALAFTYWSPRGRKADRPLDMPTVIVPSVASVPSGTGGSAAPPAAYPAPPSDPAEMDLLAALRGVPNLSVQGIAFVDVESDPRAGRLTLTITCQSPTPPTRDLVLRDALRAAQAAVQVTSAQAYSQFTVRCLGAPSGGGTPLLLVADATRAAVISLPSNSAALPSGQILAAFSSPWWSPTVPQ